MQYDTLFDSDIEKFVIQKNKTIVEALSKIEINESGIIFVVDEMKILGVLSDGDIRRLLINGISLNEKCEKLYKKDFIYGLIDEPIEEIKTKFRKHIQLIPIIDQKQQLIRILQLKDKQNIQLAEPNLGVEETINIMECINTNMISSMGNFVSEFEEQFNRYIGSKRSISVSNGTQALALCLAVNGIGIDDEVIVPDLTFAATANAVIQVGATPVLVDVDPNDWNMDVEILKKAITKKTKAIIPVHLYGLPCKMDSIMEIANTFNLLVIEDSAESLGSKLDNKNVGSIGHFSIFSFYANKVITTGEGGIICVNVDFDIEKILKMRSHGMSLKKRYWHDEWGTNVRLTNLQAAIGVAQVKKIDQFTNTKREIHLKYRNYFLDNLPNNVLYKRRESNKSYNAHWLSCFQFEGINLEDLMKFLASNLIETRPVFYPLHIQPAFKKYKAINEKNDWNSTLIQKNGLSLPSSTNLSNEKIDYICLKIKEYYERGHNE